MKIIKIYTLSDPTSNIVRYVGKTVKGRLNDRLAVHICESRKSNSSYRNSWIRGLLNKELKPVIELLDEVDEVNWVLTEQYWISQFRTWNFPLVNLTNGGDGNQGQVITKDSIKKRVNTIKRKIASGEISYVGRGAKISKALTGIKRSEETKDKVRKANLGKKYSIAARKKKSKGGIVKVDPFTMNVIEGFNFLSDAVIAMSGKGKSSIADCCNRRPKHITYKNFVWRWKNDCEDIVDACVKAQESIGRRLTTS